MTTRLGWLDQKQLLRSNPSYMAGSTCMMIVGFTYSTSRVSSNPEKWLTTLKRYGGFIRAFAWAHTGPEYWITSLTGYSSRLALSGACGG